MINIYYIAHCWQSSWFVEFFSFYLLKKTKISLRCISFLLKLLSIVVVFLCVFFIWGWGWYINNNNGQTGGISTLNSPVTVWKKANPQEYPIISVLILMCVYLCTRSLRTDRNSKLSVSTLLYILHVAFNLVTFTY